MSKPPLGLLQRLRTLLQKGDASFFPALVARSNPFDVAWCLARFPVEDRVRVLSAATPAEAAKVFQELPLQSQVEILQLGRLPALVALVTQLDSDEAADVLGALDPIEKDRWLAVLPLRESSEAKTLLAYPPDTAGGLMAKEYLTVPLHLRAGEVAARLQVLANELQNIKVTYVYVVDESGGIRGVVPIRDLIFRPRHTPISEFMVTQVTTIPDTASKRDVAELFRERNLLALPVVTPEGRLVGVITADDVIDVIQELANEEMLKLSGVTSEETRDAPLWRRMRQRLSWLSINIILNLLAASVIAIFEDTLSQVIALAFFLPIISDMSGCSGMQSVAISVRDLALQRLLLRDYLRVLFREVAVGLANGFVLGSILAIVAFALRGNPALGAVVGLAFWINSVIAVCVGGVLPLLLKYWRFDPAIASGPILTTITDMLGFLTLLGLATLWLPWLKST